jgi:hypothetical protein
VVSRLKPTYKSYPMTTLGAMGILFLYLHYTGQVDWPFWLVLLPFYIGPVALLLATAAVAAFLWIKDKVDERKRERRIRDQQKAREEMLANYATRPTERKGY